MKNIKELQDENIEKALGTIENAIAFDNEDKGNALACLELVKEKLETNKEYIKEKIDKYNELQEKASIIEEKYCDMDIKAKRYEKFAQIVIKKNVDIFALKHAHKLDTIEQSLENYNTYKNDNEDELNLFEFGLLVDVVDEMRKKVVKKV